ncbi:MAG: radical SAM protein [Elusimicrobia bacterium]|nr:radical SAM protein [Candidatus Liberimonas magnetica]
MAIEELKKGPLDKSAYRLSGCRYLHERQYKEALIEFDKALKLSKGDHEFESGVYTEKSNAFLGLKKYGLAMKQAKKAESLDPKNKNAYKLSANIYSRCRRYEEALKEFDKALELSNGDKEFESDICHEKANTYLSMKSYGPAMEQAKKSIGLNAGNKYAYKLSACINLHSRQYEEALSGFAKALELSKGDREFESDIYNELARIYFEQGKYGKLISELSKAIELNSENSMTHWLLANGYKYQGRYVEALNEFAKLMDMGRDKKSEERIQFEIIKLVECANINGSRDKALEIIKKALKLKFTYKTMIMNSLANELEIAQQAVKLKSKVRKLIVNLTNQCNLDCTMCLNQKIPKQEISARMKQEIINIFPYLEGINWMGGESFMYPGFEELLDEAVKHPLIQEITTNGLLMDKKTVSKLIENNVKLTISIDGATKEVYEEIRKGARFELLIQKLKMVNELINRINPEYKLTLNLVVVKSNYHQIEAFAEFAREYNFNAINFMVIYENRNNQNIFNFNRDDKVLSCVSKSLDNARENCKKYGIIFNTNITQDLLETKLSENQENIRNHENINNEPCQEPKIDIPDKVKICQAPWKTLNIDVTGEASPNASCFCKNVLGNLNTQSLEEIWNGEPMVNYRKQIVSGNIEKVCTLKRIYKEIPFELLR